MALPDFSQFQQQWQQRQQQISDNLDKLNKQYLSQGIQWVKNPTNPSQFIQLSVPKSPQQIATDAAATAAGGAAGKLSEPLSTTDLTKYFSPKGENPPAGTTLSDLEQGGKYSGQYTTGKSNQPITETDLKGLIDIRTGEQVPYGVTYGELASGGNQYKRLSNQEQNNRTSLQTAQSNADKLLASIDSGTINPGDYLGLRMGIAGKSGFLRNHLLSTEEDSASQQLSLLIQNYQTLLDGKRVPAQQRAELAATQFPTLYDSKSRFQKKMGNIQDNLNILEGLPDKTPNEALKADTPTADNSKTDTSAIDAIKKKHNLNY